MDEKKDGLLEDPETSEPVDTEPENTLSTDDEIVDSLALDQTESETVEQAPPETEEPSTDVESVTEPETVSAVAEPSPDNDLSSVAPIVLDQPPAPTKKSKKMLVVLLVLLSVVAVGVGVFFLVLKKDSSDTPNNETAQVEEVQKLGVAPGLIEGAVEYSTDDGQTWQPLNADADLKEGNQVRTLADGRVVLLIDDGSASRLDKNSSLELTSLSVTKVLITNISGEVYNRVVASTTREYAVLAGDQTYVAKGTAFRTSNTETEKGVEVYHSTVVASEKSTDVAEGSAYFTLNPQKEKENTVSGIDLTKLKTDEFIKWNSEQDKKVAEFATELGVLAELDKPDPVPPVVTTPKPAPASGITLSGAPSGYSASFSWKVNNVDTSQGFKLVKSKTSKTPTYPDNTAAYVEAGKTSYNLYLGDGKTYYFRICAYRGNTCESYSNTVTVTTPVKEVEKPTSGPVTLTLTGNVASWSNAGSTAPHGYKLVISEAPDVPSYGNANSTKYTSSPHTIDYLDPGTYIVRVCKYTASDYEGGCMDYSNQVSFTTP